LAFTMEAKINFLGTKLVADWKERRPFLTKLNHVLEHVALNVDFGARPYSTIRTLKDLRDSLAHGKPLHLELDRESYCNAEFANQAYEDVNGIWRQLLFASNLSLFETLSGGAHSITFIEKVIDQEA